MFHSQWAHSQKVGHYIRVFFLNQKPESKGVCASWGNMFALDQNRIPTNDRNQFFLENVKIYAKKRIISKNVFGVRLQVFFYAV